MKTTTKKFASIIVLTIATAFLLAGCGNAAKLTEYDFGTDKVPSVNAVIGEERKVTGVSTGTENGVRYKQYTYETETMVEDLSTYYYSLSELGWIVTKDFNLNVRNGEMQLGKESADKGKILIISVDFAPSQYAIRINKLDGTLEIN